MHTLRYYQQQAVVATYEYLRDKTGNPCIVCPTGAGKSHILAQICSDAYSKWNGRVLMLTHVKELVEQNATKITALLGANNVGIYSAGLKRRDMSQPIIAASIQSIYKRACDFDPFDLILIDEVHLLPPKGDGMYRQFLDTIKIINPKVRLIGLTATDYRMTTGKLCGPDELLTDVCYECGVKELIAQGFLSPLKSKSGKRKADTSNLHVRSGEFIASEVADLMEDKSLIHSACSEIIEHAKDRNHILIFAVNIAHAQHVATQLKAYTGQEVGVVTSKTPDTERGELIARFRGQTVKADLFGGVKDPLKYLVNVNVLTTGFDAPNVDCVALLRPTNSPGLYYQMVGRGLRLHPSKTDCLVLDFGGNILRHGPIDSMEIKDPKKSNGGGQAPAKECPECQEVIHAGYTLCPECGYEFVKEDNGLGHDGTASTAGVLSGEVEDTEYEVLDTTYNLHRKRGADPDAPATMRVEYHVALGVYKKEWLCFEHTGVPRHKAKAWWTARSNEPVPDTVEQALDIIDCGGISKTRGILVRSVSGEKFDKIIAYELGEKEPLLDGSDERDSLFIPDLPTYDDDIPF